ncbi:hypothetical protein DdX_21221 [Ditylenchus destructor]|uniref:RRM domain-containing protein n=1 Tax=Ditylenchus destructor TaxID=166010 RepID=A0AAD4MHN3_9BILA|nr:hypothetical protein DdX_21221 [Ditylenchus destructor]
MARLTSTIAILRNKSATGLRQTNGDKASVKISAPAKLTNKIHVSGPRLHPEGENSKARQKQEFRTYFSHFGTIVNVTVSKKSKPSNVTFTNCESAAKCIQQRTHKISGQDFLVHRSKPSEGMRKKLRANQNMPGPSTENVSAANVQSDPPAESNLGNQMPQATASSSSQVRGMFTKPCQI